MHRLGRSVALTAALAWIAATGGCGRPLYKTENPTAVAIGSVAVAGLGGVLLWSRSGCSGNSEDPDACTYDDVGLDLAKTLGGGLLIAAGVAGLGAAIYAATHRGD